MNIKTKISLGLLLLFAMLLLVSGLGMYNLYRISKNEKIVLTSNFESIEYAKNMLKAIDELQQIRDKKAESAASHLQFVKNFEDNLSKQEKNITEIGEKESTVNVRANFEDLKKALTSSDASTVNFNMAEVNKGLYYIIDLNSQSVIRKNQYSAKITEEAITLMAIVTTLCFLFCFSFIFNFPGYIANPIKELTTGIKEIANRNYDQRLQFDSKDEFGELSEAFNVMAQRLDEYEHSALADVISEKRRIEAIIDAMQDPVIGLDENNCILFANIEAAAVLGLKKEDIIGKYAPDVALKNDLLRKLLTDASNQPLKIFADQKESYFDKKIIDVKADDKKIGSVVLLRNITLFQERDADHTNLMAGLFHELKTQISASTKTLSVLETTLNQDQQNIVRNIKENLEKLTRIAGELTGETDVKR